jgi:AraC-like DNA-binding protein
MRQILDRKAESTVGILEPDRGRVHFELERRRPAEDLAAHVDRHWIVRWDLGEGNSFVQRILPHPCVNLSSEPGLIAVYGIPLEVSPHRIEGAGVVVGTKFRPGGFAGFTDLSVFELNDRRVALSQPFGDDGARLERALAERAGDPDAHLAAVEGFLRGRLPDPDSRYEIVSRVVDEMLGAPPAITVAELAERQAVSQRTLQRLFRDYVGVGPKWVLKRYRMHEAAERIAAGEASDGAALAADLGYFDQSHFIHDFTAQIGVSPGEYARACATAAGREVEPVLA